MGFNLERSWWNSLLWGRGCGCLQPNSAAHATAAPANTAPAPALAPSASARAAAPQPVVVACPASAFSTADSRVVTPAAAPSATATPIAAAAASIAASTSATHQLADICTVVRYFAVHKIWPRLTIVRARETPHPRGSLSARIAVAQPHIQRLRSEFTRRRLAHIGLNGTIPSVLGSLAVVETVDLSYNNFVGTIPPSLSNLHTVQVLDLSGNNLGLTLGQPIDVAFVAKTVAIPCCFVIFVVLIYSALQTRVNRNGTSELLHLHVHIEVKAANGCFTRCYTPIWEAAENVVNKMSMTFRDASKFVWFWIDSAVDRIFQRLQKVAHHLGIATAENATADTTPLQTGTPDFHPRASLPKAKYSRFYGGDEIKCSFVNVPRRGKVSHRPSTTRIVRRCAGSPNLWLLLRGGQGRTRIFAGEPHSPHAAFCCWR